MPILTNDHIDYAISKMSNFHSSLKEIYSKNGLNLFDNIGRRNILMSDPMEKFVSEALSKDGYQVSSDGRPGEPDIFVEDLNLEIECKLTSPHSNGSINFQTDFETLQKKGKLDYLYLITDKEFENFCALYFEGLTIEDFRNLSNGARGKVGMYKWKGMKKCTILRGDAINITSEGKRKSLEKEIKKYVDDVIIKGRMIENLNIPSPQKKSELEDWKNKKLKNIDKLKESYQNSLNLKSRWKFILK